MVTQENRIAEFRKKANLTQRDLARLCGLKSESRLCNYETNRRTVDLDTAREIVWQLNRFVDCTLDEVFPPRRKGKPRKVVELAVEQAEQAQDEQ